MPEILIFFLGGLTASACVGVVFYFAVGDSIGALVERVFPSRTGSLWGRTLRIQLMLMAIVGGLSTQWYGCGGYTDYQSIAGDRRLMFEKSTSQVSGAIGYAQWSLIGAAALGAIAIAVLSPGQGSGAQSPQHGPQREGTRGQ